MLLIIQCRFGYIDLKQNKLTRHIIPLMSPMPIGKITPSENADVLTRKPNNMANKIQTA